jgi:hypothetical protein
MTNRTSLKIKLDRRVERCRKGKRVPETLPFHNVMIIGIKR